MKLRFFYVLAGSLIVTACQFGPGPSVSTPTPTAASALTGVPTPRAELTTTSPVTGAATPTRSSFTTPTAGASFAAAAPFALVLAENAALRAKLGEPTGPSLDVDGTQAQFEHGAMLWRKDLLQIYVFYEGGKWEVYPDTWDTSQPLVDPAMTPPTGLFQPIRGFGKVWWQNKDVKLKLGWAREEEKAVSTTWQSFQGGLVVWRGGTSFRALFADNTWADFPLPARPAAGPTPTTAQTQSSTLAGTPGALGPTEAPRQPTATPAMPATVEVPPTRSMGTTPLPPDITPPAGYPGPIQPPPAPTGYP